VGKRRKGPGRKPNGTGGKARLKDLDQGNNLEKVKRNAGGNTSVGSLEWALNITRRRKGKMKKKRRKGEKLNRCYSNSAPGGGKERRQKEGVCLTFNISPTNVNSKKGREKGERKRNIADTGRGQIEGEKSN